MAMGFVFFGKEHPHSLHLNALLSLLYPHIWHNEEPLLICATAIPKS